MRQADYVLALKGNQGTLREDVELLAQSHKAQDFADTKGTQHQSVEGDLLGRPAQMNQAVIHMMVKRRARHA